MRPIAQQPVVPVLVADPERIRRSAARACPSSRRTDRRRPRGRRSRRTRSTKPLSGSCTTSTIRPSILFDPARLALARGGIARTAKHRNDRHNRCRRAASCGLRGSGKAEFVAQRRDGSSARSGRNDPRRRACAPAPPARSGGDEARACRGRSCRSRGHRFRPGAPQSTNWMPSLKVALVSRDHPQRVDPGRAPDSCGCAGWSPRRRRSCRSRRIRSRRTSTWLSHCESTAAVIQPAVPPPTIVTFRIGSAAFAMVSPVSRAHTSAGAMPQSTPPSAIPKRLESCLVSKPPRSHDQAVTARPSLPLLTAPANPRERANLTVRPELRRIGKGRASADRGRRRLRRSWRDCRDRRRARAFHANRQLLSGAAPHHPARGPRRRRLCRRDARADRAVHRRRLRCGCVRPRSRRASRSSPTGRNRSSPAQRAPHFDSTDPDYIAILHYLGGTDRTGTAFYRQRTTGIEAVDETNLARFVETARRESGRLAGYIAGSNRFFEQIEAIEAVPDRIIIYQGCLLHSGLIPADLVLTGSSEARAPDRQLLHPPATRLTSSARRRLLSARAQARR